MSNYKKQPKVRIKETGEVEKVEALDFRDKPVIENVETENRYYSFDEIEFITDEESYQERRCRESLAIHDKETKVSDCCGAKIGAGTIEHEVESDAISDWVNNLEPTLMCMSCGEPCEAVEDTKPDPIEPLEPFDAIPTYSLFWNKINEIIERLNLLSKHE